MAALGRMSVDSNLSLEAGIVFFVGLKALLHFPRKEPAEHCLQWKNNNNSPITARYSCIDDSLKTGYIVSLRNQYTLSHCQSYCTGIFVRDCAWGRTMLHANVRPELKSI
jgi:hypothetical protein